MFEYLGSEQGFYTSMQLCSVFVRRFTVDLQLLSIFRRPEDECVFYENRKWLWHDASDLSHDPLPMKLQSLAPKIQIVRPSRNPRSDMAALSAPRSIRLSLIADGRTGSRLYLVLRLVHYREYEYGFAFRL